MITLVLGTSTGGVGVHVLSLARAVLATGAPVRVAAPESTLAAFAFEAAGARTAVVPIGPAGREPLAVAALRRATADAELVHAHGLRAGTAAVLARRRPLVVTWHNAVLAGGLRGRLMSVGERFVAHGATVNLAASADLAERIGFLGARDVRLAPVAPPAPRPTRAPGDVRAELGLGAGTPLVVCVGRLHAQKAHDVLIDAATQWARLDPAPVVVIAGAGPSRSGLAARIRATAAPVRLLGHRADTADLLAAADLVVLASRWEARPLAVQEAMILGRPVVATDVGGVAGLAEDGAVLVRPDDVDDLAGAVAALLGDQARRLALGERAAVVAAGWPDEAAATGAVLAMYAGMIG